MIHPKAHCSYCGAEITPILVGAETEYGFYGETATFPIGTRYDITTGKRQYLRKYICPYYRKKGFLFRSPHDSYFIEKIVSE